MKKKDIQQWHNVDVKDVKREDRRQEPSPLKQILFAVLIALGFYAFIHLVELIRIFL